MNLLTQTTNKVRSLVVPQQPSTQTTELYPFTKEQYLLFRDAFKIAAQNKNVTASDMILYNIVRGHSIDRGFTPTTNKVKLINGQRSTQALKGACWHLRFLLNRNLDKLNKKFNGFINTDTDKTTILQLIAKELGVQH